MGKVIFVSGTDTGVGKTSVLIALVRALRASGTDLRVMKPAETGCELGANGELIPADGKLLMEAADNGQTLSEIVPFRFRSPVAPLVAARGENRKLSLGELLSRISQLQESTDILLIEGAGGLLVPLCEETTFLDLIQACEAEVLLIVGSRLGALNQAALSFEVLQARRVPVLGYILNHPIAPTDMLHRAAIETNREILREIAEEYGVTELGVVPHGEVDKIKISPGFIL